MTQTATITTDITNNNAMEIFERLIVGTIRSENYNSDSFGMTEMKRRIAMNNALDTFIDKTIDAGYSDDVILGPMLKQYDYHLESNSPIELKQKLDDVFYLDMSEHAQAIQYGYHVFDETKQSIAKGLMRNR